MKPDTEPAESPMTGWMNVLRPSTDPAPTAAESAGQPYVSCQNCKQPVEFSFQHFRKLSGFTCAISGLNPEMAPATVASREAGATPCPMCNNIKRHQDGCAYGVLEAERDRLKAQRDGYSHLNDSDMSDAELIAELFDLLLDVTDDESQASGTILSKVKAMKDLFAENAELKARLDHQTNLSERAAYELSIQEAELSELRRRIEAGEKAMDEMMHAAQGIHIREVQAMAECGTWEAYKAQSDDDWKRLDEAHKSIRDQKPQ